MHQLIENYVAEVTKIAQTPRPFAAPVAVEAGLQGEELRQHLHELMQAHQELGLDATDAAEAAIAQFGSAKTVRRGLTQTNLRGALRSRAFWQAAVLATAAQIALNSPGNALLGRSGKVDALALMQLYSGHVDFVFALTWLVHLLIVGKITARFCPRYAPLAASLFAVYQAIYWIVFVVVTVSAEGDLPPLTLGSFLSTGTLLIISPPAIYALFAWGFVRREAARKMRRA